MRSLFQLSLIPPNERDPARFWQQTKSGPAFNEEEFFNFCRDHPQLVRRLRDGMAREISMERKRQFRCERPDKLVEFLEENFDVPSIYVVEPLPPGVPSRLREWHRVEKDRLLEVEQRFPVLPPSPKRVKHRQVYDPSALDDDSALYDHTDAYAVAHGWYCYAQEPLPPPGDLPGSTQEITNRARHRRPRNMTTMIFRNYPAQGRRYMAERLQQEGWYDEEGYDLSEWFPTRQGVMIGGGHRWSQDAWETAYLAWKKNGEDNHLILEPNVELEQARLAAQFAARRQLQADSNPPDLREEDLRPEERELYRAARFMFELRFYRRVTNFTHHLNRSFVEKLPETVACRKFFFQADHEQYRLASPRAALALYRNPPPRVVKLSSLSQRTPAVAESAVWAWAAPRRTVADLSLSVLMTSLLPDPHARIRLLLGSSRSRFAAPQIIVEGTTARLVCPSLAAANEAQSALNGRRQIDGVELKAEVVPFIERWGDRSPVEAWRDLVLLGNKDFRRDNFIQEQTAEIQIRYLWLSNRHGDGGKIKDQLAKLAPLLPLMPKFTQDEFPAPIVLGPFDLTVGERRRAMGEKDIPEDEKNEPIVGDQQKQQILQRMGLAASRPLPAVTAPGAAPPISSRP